MGAAHSGQFDIGNSTNAYAWDASVVNTGQDSAYARGQVIHVAWRASVAGGFWYADSYAWSRTLHTIEYPWLAHGAVGARGVSDALMVLYMRLPGLSQQPRIHMDQPTYPGRFWSNIKKWRYVANLSRIALPK